MSEDRLDLLAQAVYGRKAKPREYLGGSDAQFLEDAANKIRELEAQLAACEWKPITETDPPKVGDEAVGRDKTSVFIDGSFRIILRSVSDATVKLKMDDWNRLGYYHFRAINPPQ